MAEKSVLGKTYNFILDLLFPIYCLGCGEDGEWICKKCLVKIELLKKQACPVCGNESRTGARCFNCRAKTELDGLIAATAFLGKERQETLAKKAIHIFKYRFVKDMAMPLSDLIIKQLQGRQIIKIPARGWSALGGKNRQILKEEKAVIFGPVANDKIIIPVPLHARRFCWRGFNQAELLADNIAVYFKLPLEKTVLARRKNNIPQAEVKERRERIENIKDAFVCGDSGKIKDKTIILIDDVATTSATLGECAKALKSSGAKEVWGVVVARGG